MLGPTFGWPAYMRSCVIGPVVTSHGDLTISIWMSIEPTCGLVSLLRDARKGPQACSRTLLATFFIYTVNQCFRAPQRQSECMLYKHGRQILFGLSVEPSKHQICI